jgi:general secretion pathway protein F
MSLFRYEAVAASGELVHGERDAVSEQDLVDWLHAQGHVPVRAEPAGGGSLARLLRQPLTLRARRRGPNLAIVTQQLATLLHAGLSLDRVLDIARTVAPQKAEKEALGDVLDKVRGGKTLADALAAQEGMFPGFYIGMVRAGEAGGSLDQTLHQLGDFLERSQAAREQVKSALMYPAIVLVTGCASIAVLFGFVVPRFRPLFEDAGAALPVAAQTILAIADIFRDDWWALLLGSIGLGALVLQQWHSVEGRRRLDHIVVRLPLLGDLIVKSEVSRFARTLGTLLKNGVAPLTALTITQETLRNAAIREAIATLGDHVKEGKGLADPLAQLDLVPPLLVHLTRVGEETARLEEMLLKTAEIFEHETRRSVERLLAILVPAITVGLGALVAVVIGSILSAILSVYDLAV